MEPQPEENPPDRGRFLRVKALVKKPPSTHKKTFVYSGQTATDRTLSLFCNHSHVDSYGGGDDDDDEESYQAPAALLFQFQPLWFGNPHSAYA
jgi:hypothetical protein